MAAAPGDLITLNVLPLPTTAGEVDWKQYLFYMIAYSDTFHDFAKERKLEGEGRSVTSSDIPNRVNFVMDLIDKMDSSIPFKSVYLPIINSFKKSTFENNVYSAFTRLLKNNLIESIPNEAIKRSIQEYLPTVFSLIANEELIQQDMNETAFQTPGQIPRIQAKIIELYMPAVVYRDDTKDNFIGFLKSAYSECIDADTKLKFVEDTASFPRNIFTEKLDNFKKIITTQTKWDPAGLSKIDGPTDIARQNVSAPSFRSTQKSNSPQDTFTAQSAYFEQATDKITYPGNTYRITKAGPSVNHLFMHMALEGDSVSPQLKEKFKQMIRASKKDSKKNMVLPLDAEAGTASNSDIRLRRLTSSKRSGDYENIHSAIQTGSLMFTGDEPAFTYGVLNKCPIVFHSCSVSGHHFKLYIPPPKDLVLAAREVEERAILDAVLRAAELQKLFGITDIFYKSFFKNLKDAVYSSDEISVYGNVEAGRFLQEYIRADIIEVLSENLDIKAFRGEFQQLMGAMGPLANYEEIDTKTLQAGNFNEKLQSALSKINIPELKERNKYLDVKLSDIRQYIPLRFHKTLTHVNAVNATLFKPTRSGQAFLVNGVNRYNLEPSALFPDYKNMETNIGDIAKLLNLNKKITNERLIKKNTASLKRIYEELNYPGIPTPESAAATRTEAIKYIDRWLVSEGGLVNVKKPMTARHRKKSNSKGKTRKRFNGVNLKPSTNKYESLHKAISAFDSSNIPFKLTPQNYADLIVYRLVINDVILKISPNKIEIKNEKHHGGAVMTVDMMSYCMDLFENHIGIFFRKHLDATGNSHDLLVSILRSVIGGTFIQDVELLLSEISNSPTFPHDINTRLYENMKSNATTALDSIFKMLDTSYSNAKTIVKVHERNHSARFDQIKAVVDYYLATPPPRISDNFFQHMDIITHYFNELFIEGKGEAVPRAKAEDAMNALDDEPTFKDKDILQDYVKYALNDYLEVEIIGSAAAAGAAGATGAAPSGHPGGGHGGGSIERALSRQRRRRNGSPRRKSLKNR
jgi:hypothetical protein